MPSKGRSNVTTKHKAAIAAGRIAGKTAKEIAAEIGASPSTVAKAAVGPEVKGIISRAMVALEPRMFGLFGRVLDSLEADMASETLTPDQRERARAQAVTVLQLGQPKPPESAAGVSAGPGGGQMLTDVLTVYRQLVTAPPAFQEG